MMSKCKSLLFIAIIFMIAITLAINACRKKQTPASLEIQATSLPKININDNTKMLLTFVGPNNIFSTVTKIEDVPQERKGWARVVDLGMKPDRRKDHELVYVADLRKKNKDDTYPYVVMSRKAFELSAIGHARDGVTDPVQNSTSATSDSVILYATQWCSACKAAREYMTQNKIPFIERDIEKDPNASSELMRKAQAAGISPNGVPVLDVKGHLMQGFDPNQLQALLSSGGTK